MKNKFWLGLVIVIAGAAASGCAPLVAVGGVVLLDEVMEQENGGDGLF
jgi:hypothetical protein